MTSPGRERLRTVHPLVDGDGHCRLLYDLERTMVLPVPEPLQPLLADELDGSAASATREWLTDEGVLTCEPPISWAQGTESRVPKVTDVSLDLSGACNMGCVYCFENDIHSRIGRMSEETAMASLDFAFRQARDAPRVALHFGSGEPLLRFDLLRKVVAEAEARVERTDQEITFELTTNATRVTSEIAHFLAVHPFNVRVSCDGPAHVHDHHRPMVKGGPSYPAVKRGLKVLLQHLPERTTVNSVLANGTRLRELWEWAKRLGLRRYHVIKVGAYEDEELNLQVRELRQFRTDLEAICDDLFAELEAGRAPMDYQPITKIVRRLMIPEPVTRFCGVAGSYLGVATNGRVYPCFRHLGLERYELGDIHKGVDDQKRQRFFGREAADVDSRPICRDCWARYLCGGGCYADSTVYGPDRLAPQVQHCPFWRTEIELAIRFYRRLLDADPTYCLQLFGDDPEDVLAFIDQTPSFLERKNCL